MALSLVPTQQQLTFIQILEQLPNEVGRYELVNGEIVRTLPTQQHEDIADFIADAFKNEVKRCHFNYRASDRIVIKTLTPTGTKQGRQPDVNVVDRTLWELNRNAYTAFIEPLQVAVEVVSTNWEDDYVDKLDEYQRLGIAGYWIVDYLAIASRSYL